MGRPTRLTGSIQTKICKVISAGNYAATAYKSVGIGERTYYDWMKRGEVEDAIAEEDDKETHNSAFANFYRAVRKAEATREEKLCELISTHGAEDWRAAAHMLAIFHPEKYSIQHHIKHGGQVNHQVDHHMPLNLENLSIDELRDFKRLLGKAGPARDRQGTSEEGLPGLHVVGVPGVQNKLAPPTGGEET